MNELATHTRPTEKNIIERVRAMILDNRRSNIDEGHNIWTSVVVLHNKSSTTDLVFIKFLQNGFQNNSQKSTTAAVWQSAKALFNCFCHEGNSFWDTLPLETIRGSTITSQRANARVWSGIIRHHQSKRSSKVNHQPEKWCSHFSGTHKPNFGTLSRGGHNGKRCPLLWNAPGPGETSYLMETLRATVKRCYIVAWQYPSTYCHQYCGNPVEIELWGVGASSVRSWPGPLGLSPCLVHSKTL